MKFHVGLKTKQNTSKCEMVYNFTTKESNTNLTKEMVL